MIEVWTGSKTWTSTSFDSSRYQNRMLFLNNVSIRFEHFLVQHVGSHTEKTRLAWRKIVFGFANLIRLLPHSLCEVLEWCIFGDPLPSFALHSERLLLMQLNSWMIPPVISLAREEPLLLCWIRCKASVTVNLVMKKPSVRRLEMVSSSVYALRNLLAMVLTCAWSTLTWLRLSQLLRRAQAQKEKEEQNEETQPEAN